MGSGRSLAARYSYLLQFLVAVVLGLVRAFDGHADVVGLLLGELW